MQAITSCQISPTGKIDHVHKEIGLIHMDLNSFRGGVTEVEQRVSSLEDVQRDQNADLHNLKIKVKHLEARAEDAENRNRHNNLRIIGLPEGLEGSDTATFTEILLQALLLHANDISWWKELIACLRLVARKALHPTHLYLNCCTSGTVMWSFMKPANKGICFNKIPSSSYSRIILWRRRV